MRPQSGPASSQYRGVRVLAKKMCLSGETTIAVIANSQLRFIANPADDGGWGHGGNAGCAPKHCPDQQRSQMEVGIGDDSDGTTILSHERQSVCDIRHVRLGGGAQWRTGSKERGAVP